jgi:hypothetical protein
MKLTEKHADELVRDVWTWLAENPGEEKYEWPRWNEIKHMRCSCPYCEIHQKEKTDYECNTCPLFTANKCCLDDDSPFLVWVSCRIGKEGSSVYAAREIAQVAIGRLEKNEYGQ